MRHQPAAQGPLRPAPRTRRLRRGIRRHPHRSGEPPDRRPGSGRAAQPRSTVVPPGPNRSPATVPDCSSRYLTTSSARSSTSSCQQPGATRSGWPSSPTTTSPRRPPFARIAELAAEEDLAGPGLARGADDAGSARCDRTFDSCRGSVSCSSPRTVRARMTPVPDGDRPRPACLLPAQEGRAGNAGLLPQPVRPHAGLQGHAHDRTAGAVLPGPLRPPVRLRRSPSCTRGSRPTPSRAGRWRTRTASSRTTARSTPSWATATGCARVSRSCAVT